MKRDLFRFFIGVITIWVWLPCIVMIETSEETRKEFKEFFTSDKMAHVIHHIAMANETNKQDKTNGSD